MNVSAFFAGAIVFGTGVIVGAVLRATPSDIRAAKNAVKSK